MCHVRPVNALIFYVVVKSHGIAQVGHEELTVGAVDVHLPDQVTVGEYELWLHHCNRQNNRLRECYVEKGRS